MFGLAAFFFGTVAVVILLVLGVTMVSLFGTAKDKASTRAERLLAWGLLLCLATGFVVLHLVLLVAAIL